MPVKSYVQQASASLQQAVMSIGSDETDMIRRYEADINKLQSEISNIDTQRNINVVNMAAKDDKLQADIARAKIIDLEKEKSDKEAQIAKLQDEMSQQRHTLQQVKSELQGLSSSVQSTLGRSGLV